MPVLPGVAAHAGRTPPLVLKYAYASYVGNVCVLNIAECASVKHASGRDYTQGVVSSASLGGATTP